MQNIAHRGASVDELENTLEAFALAVEQGADMIETDLHLLRDGVVALYHDDEIAGVPVGELTLSELRGHLPRAPTLQEALDRFGARIPWNLEIKSPTSGDYAGLERIALDEVRRRGILEQTLFSSFSDSVLARLRALERRSRLGTLVSVYQPGEILERARHVGSEAVHLHLLLASEERVQEAHAAGFRVNVYTVDDPAAQRRLSGFGVDGVFTNLPGRLRANLSA
ncbi:MAG: glycerophosphodiester phosphodiesterase [Deltaproteobacteria bacterium]|nr:glycerophosphodiester phosphodiesterase [Deltaproteobacteria bacterium]